MLDVNGAVRALDEGDHEGALTLLLQAWEMSRAPALAEVIFAVGERASALLPALGAATPSEDTAHALELWRQRRASDVERLLADLDAAVATGHAADVLPRLDEIVRARPDPRVARAIARLLAAPPPLRTRANSAVQALCEALHVHADPALAETLTAVAAPPRDGRIGLAARQRTLVRQELATWPLRFPAGTVPDLAPVHAALARAPRVTTRRAATPDGAALLAAIYADPDDDGARSVYADWLIERGDARGEFIALQLGHATSDGVAAKARQDELLEENRETWLRPLAGLTDETWERGFPVAGAVVKWHKSEAEAEAALTRVEWSTLERIHFEELVQRRKPLLTEAMISLEEARGLTTRWLRRLSKLSRPLRRLHTLGLDGVWTCKKIDPLLRLLDSDRLPALRVLEVSEDDEYAYDDPTANASWTKAIARLREALPSRIGQLRFSCHPVHRKCVARAVADGGYGLTMLGAENLGNGLDFVRAADGRMTELVVRCRPLSTLAPKTQVRHFSHLLEGFRDCPVTRVTLECGEPYRTLIAATLPPAWASLVDQEPLPS